MASWYLSSGRPLVHVNTTGIKQRKFQPVSANVLSTPSGSPRSALEAPRIRSTPLSVTGAPVFCREVVHTVIYQNLGTPNDVGPGVAGGMWKKTLLQVNENKKRWFDQFSSMSHISYIGREP